MPKKLRIGIVGCGAIGSSLAKAIIKDFKDTAKLVALYDSDALRAGKLSKKLSVASLEALVRKADLVIEAASAQGSWDIAKYALKRGRSILVMSVGGILTHTQELLRLSEKHRAKVYIASGALCGIDGLKGARMGKVKSVALTTIKNPLSFKGVRFVEEKGIKLGQLKKDLVLFSGTAREAVRHFPQNINVAAVLSLAGLGADKTRVRIIASPFVKKNIHEVEIRSKAADIFTRTQNVVHPDNPKTSYLAVLSAIAALKGILQPVKIGT